MKLIKEKIVIIINLNKATSWASNVNKNSWKCKFEDESHMNLLLLPNLCEAMENTRNWTRLGVEMGFFFRYEESFHYCFCCYYLGLKCQWASWNEMMVAYLLSENWSLIYKWKDFDQVLFISWSSFRLRLRLSYKTTLSVCLVIWLRKLILIELIL